MSSAQSTTTRIALWKSFDSETKKNIDDLEKNNPAELEDAFRTNLSFGTGGLRGVMGVGTNRINQYTISFATQGLAQYLLTHEKTHPIKVAIAFDSRHNSDLFASVCADVLSANGIEVYLFSAPRPTPELSFAIRHVGCHAGIVITASHNPKEYNGYKVYASDGGQIISPQDKEILSFITPISTPAQVKNTRNRALVNVLSDEMDNAYAEMICARVLSQDNTFARDKINICYTPIHGAGGDITMLTLQKAGFKNAHIVASQAKPDGTFHSAPYPNPEEKEAMKIGLAEAKKINADLLIGTDPDADRIGIGIKNKQGAWELLNGNQIAALLFAYVLERAQKTPPPALPYFGVKTIVTSDIILSIAQHFNTRCDDVLTGFKWIAAQIEARKNTHTFLVGCEESHGLLIGADTTRDKDGVAATAIFCEMFAYYQAQGIDAFSQLENLYLRYGFFADHLISITKKGAQGSREIAQIMDHLRSTPPVEIAQEKVIMIHDYECRISRNMQSHTTHALSLPVSNVLQFILADGTKISFRPSGTEPKIKCYISAIEKVEDKNSLAHVQAVVETKTAAMEMVCKKIMGA